jgi:GNAT superfamily N-acetyltransferase
MSDLLVRLYALPSDASWFDRAAAAGITIRRCDAWDRFPMRRFITKHFGETWASETDFAFASGHPITAFVAVKDGAIAGFAAFECTRRGYFGPTGVREDLRGSGAGAALLMRCLEAMREMGYAYAIIGGAGPGGFYEKVCGATVIEGSDPGIYGDLYRERDARGEQEA